MDVTSIQPASCTAFLGFRRIATGPLSTVVLVARQALQTAGAERVLVFRDDSGHLIDIDQEWHDGATALPLAMPEPAVPDSAVPPLRGRGRPRLGVVSREVTLLPRHWEWLNARPGGASVALRQLVDAACQTAIEADRKRERAEAAHRFMSSMARDIEGFDRAVQSLFATNRAGFERAIANWPRDIQLHARRLAMGSDDG